MTTREFFETVINANVSEEITAYAQAGIKKLDERNSKRAEKPTKTQLANEPIKVAIREYLVDKKAMASEIGKALEISTQKASSLCVQLVKEDVLKVEDTKVAKKGVVKVYSLK